MQRPPLKAMYVLSAIAAAFAVGGCGWTPRDEFIHNRQVVIHSEPGDGSRYTFGRSGDSPLAAEQSGLELVFTGEP